MITTSAVRKIYADLQKQLFYLIPEKWESIYLYASVTEQILNLETGELFFYYYPKGILKKNPVNVYEIPNRFRLNEEEYIKLVEKLYNTVKQLRQVYRDSGQRMWNSITIRLVGLKFEIEFDYEQLDLSEYSNTERHIIWKYKNLGMPIETFTRENRKLIQNYLENEQLKNEDIEIYSESIYKRPIKNRVEYNREQVNFEDEYINEMEEQKKEEEAKRKLEEQRYRYRYVTKKKNLGLRKKVKKETEKEPTYIEQIEAQRAAVKSQILDHQ